MARNFDLLVFDWDGTLMDSAGAITAAIIAAATDLGLPPPPPERARHVIGLGLHDALRHAVPELPPSDYGRMTERYRHHFLADDHRLELFPGVAGALQSLAEAGWLLAVATGKSRAGLRRALAQSELEGLFHATRCADECFSKPHPAMLLELMDELDVTPERTVMIGDTTHDLGMAQNAGVAGVGVSFGAHPKEALLELSPLVCCDTPQQLFDWLATHG